MRDIKGKAEPRRRVERVNCKRVLLIYREWRDGCAYALSLLRKDIEEGKGTLYLPSRMTEELQRTLVNLMDWVKEGTLKVIGLEAVEDYLKDPSRIGDGGLLEDAQIYLDLGSLLKWA